MQNDQSAGLDGPPAEFYKFFWQYIKIFVFVQLTNDIPW